MLAETSDSFISDAFLARKAGYLSQREMYTCQWQLQMWPHSHFPNPELLYQLRMSKHSRSHVYFKHQEFGSASAVSYDAYTVLVAVPPNPVVQWSPAFCSWWVCFVSAWVPLLTSVHGSTGQVIDKIPLWLWSRHISHVLGSHLVSHCVILVYLEKWTRLALNLQNLIPFLKVYANIQGSVFKFLFDSNLKSCWGQAQVCCVLWYFLLVIAVTSMNYPVLAVTHLCSLSSPKQKFPWNNRGSDLLHERSVS